MSLPPTAQLSNGTAFGLSLSSSFPLPTQIVSTPQEHPDITLGRGSVDHLDGVPATPLGHRFKGQTAFLDFQDVGFNVFDGATIVTDLPPHADPRVATGSVLGPVLGVVMLQRGRSFLVHASGATIEGLTVGMAGASGIGKSTLAAWCFLHGSRVITDDILAILDDGEVLEALPAYPIVKLWDEGAILLGLDPDDLDIIEPGLEKRALDVRPSFVPDQTRLDALVVIERRAAEPAAQRLRGREALIALEGISYGLSSLHASGGAGDHFQRAAKIASRLPLVGLSLPQDLSVDATMEYVIDAARKVGGN
jgi:hypothetical protein